MKRLGAMICITIGGLLIHMSATADPLAFKSIIDGSNGAGPLNQPYGVAIGGGGNVYITDTANNRLLKFDANGGFLEDCATFDNGNELLNTPRGLAISDAGTIYIADNGNHRILVVDTDCNFIDSFGSFGSGIGQLHGPTGVALDGEGDIYVTDANDRVQTFDAQGTPSILIPTGILKNPHGVVVDAAGNVYVADPGNHLIQVFDANGGFVEAFGGFGNIDGKFNQPIGVALDDEGNIYVVDATNHRVQIFDNLFTHVVTFGQLGSGDGDFDNPRGIALNSDGDIYLADTGNDRIQIFCSLEESLTAEEIIEDLLDEGVLNKGRANALLKKLDGPLHAFVNQVNAFVNAGILTQEQADELLAAVGAAKRLSPGQALVTWGIIKTFAR